MRPTTNTLRLREGGRGAAMSEWIPADKELPGNPRCVLATDGEAHFIAVYDHEGEMANRTILMGRKWYEAFTGEEIDSVITHWMELPEVPE
jgi:hypothetical protein